MPSRQWFHTLDQETAPSTSTYKYYILWYVVHRPLPLCSYPSRLSNQSTSRATPVGLCWPQAWRTTPKQGQSLGPPPRVGSNEAWPGCAMMRTGNPPRVMHEDACLPANSQSFCYSTFCKSPWRHDLWASPGPTKRPGPQPILWLSRLCEKRHRLTGAP